MSMSEGEAASVLPLSISLTCHFWSYSLFSSVSVNSTLVAELRSIALADLFSPIQSLLKGPLFQLVSAGFIRVLSAQALRDYETSLEPNSPVVGRHPIPPHF